MNHNQQALESIKNQLSCVEKEITKLTPKATEHWERQLPRAIELVEQEVKELRDILESKILLLDEWKSEHHENISRGQVHSKYSTGLPESNEDRRYSREQPCGCMTITKYRDYGMGAVQTGSKVELCPKCILQNKQKLKIELEQSKRGYVDNIKAEQKREYEKLLEEEKAIALKKRKLDQLAKSFG